MKEFQKVAQSSDIEEGTCAAMKVGNEEIALYRVGGQYYATGNICPHRGGPLAEGVLAGTTIACPWHGWEFDCRTGASSVNGSIQIPSYPVKVEGEDILVEI